MYHFKNGKWVGESNEREKEWDDIVYKCIDYYIEIGTCSVERVEHNSLTVCRCRHT